jgi:hypothetical protein
MFQRVLLILLVVTQWLQVALQLRDEIRVDHGWAEDYAGITIAQKVASMEINADISIRTQVRGHNELHVFKTLQESKPFNLDLVLAGEKMSDLDEMGKEDINENRAGVKKSAVTWIPSVMPPVSQMTLCLEKWRAELGDDYDKAAYILEGVQHGFLITDCFLDIASSRRSNYKSTCLPEAICSVEKQIRLEMEMGRYVICENIPSSFLVWEQFQRRTRG